MLVHIVHLKALGREAWDDLGRALHLLQAGVKEGLPITADAFPYIKTGSLLYTLLPPWARDGGKQMILQRVGDPKQKRIIVEDIRALTLHYEKITVASAKKTSYLVGKTVEEVSKDLECVPEEAILEMLLLNDLAVTIFGEIINEKNLEAIYREPYVYFSTDGVGRGLPQGQEHDLVHPRSFGASARFLQEYVREKSILSWEHAIQMMTAGPAGVVGLKDRGTLEKGMQADVVVFNPKEINDRATYTNPFQFPSGISWVLINGSIIVENGVYNGGHVGKVLRKRV